MGITNLWINPFQHISAWDSFFERRGYQRQFDSGTVAIFNSRGKYTHCAARNESQGFDWQSKIGAELRILHSLMEITSLDYGHANWFYGPAVRSAAAVAEAQPVLGWIYAASAGPQLAKLSGGLTSAVKAEFQRRFAVWKATWFEGAMAFSDDTRDRANGAEYRQVLELGSAVLPLVVNKLIDPENFMAATLYQDLQEDEESQGADPTQQRVSVQEEAHDIVQAYLKR